METVKDLPGGSQSGRIDWQKACRAADRADGDWVKVGQMSASIASRINSGEYASVDEQVYEATTRRTDHLGHRVDSDVESQAWLYLRRYA